MAPGEKDEKRTSEWNSLQQPFSPSWPFCHCLADMGDIIAFLVFLALVLGVGLDIYLTSDTYRRRQFRAASLERQRKRAG